MSSKQWVQHISGQGEKWEVHPTNDAVAWYVEPKDPTRGRHVLPRSEYRLCTPPERWVDVTGECEWVKYPNGMDRDGEYFISHKGTRIEANPEVMGYRLRKVQLYDHDMKPQHAFLVETKVTE